MSYNRNKIKKANDILKEIEDLELQLKGWRESIGFNGFDGKFQISSSGKSQYYNIDLKTAPFEDLKEFYIKQCENRIKVLESSLKQNLHQ